MVNFRRHFVRCGAWEEVPKRYRDVSKGFFLDGVSEGIDLDAVGIDVGFELV